MRTLLLPIKLKKHIGDLKNNYQSFVSANQSRQHVIYAGANDGMLHAFNSITGEEEWGFIPPFIASKLPTIINKAYDGKFAGDPGGTNPIFGVDGSPVVHDMYIQGLNADGAYEEGKSWRTILMIPYGRGGAGFSVLDVTNPIINGGQGPLHMYSVFNEFGETQSYEYVASSYNINQLKEAITVTGNFSSDPKVGNEICDNTANNQCYLSNTWTLVTNPKVPGLTNNDFRVNKEGINYNNFTTDYDGAGDIVFTFGDTMRFLTYDDPNLSTSELLITFEAGSAGLGVQSEPGYDYSRLGETWSQPRIVRMPNQGAGDTNIEDDIY